MPQQQPQHHPVAVSENNGKANSPNVINIDLDNDRGPPLQPSNIVDNRNRSNQHQPQSHQHQQQQQQSSAQAQQQQQSQPPPPQRDIMTKNITFGELTESIIAKDYGPNPMHLRPAPYMAYMQDPQAIVTPDRWKYTRRMQQKEAEAAAAAAAAVADRNKNASQAGRSNTPDDRIIRMPQAISPRKYMHHEMIMPQQPHESHYYLHQGPTMGAIPVPRTVGGAGSGVPHDQRMPGGSSGGGGGGGLNQFDTMKYVKNRIVEAMRTEDERRPEDMHGIHHSDRDRNDVQHHRHPPSHQQQHQQHPHQQSKDHDGLMGGKQQQSGGSYEEISRRSNVQSHNNESSSSSHHPSAAASYQQQQPPPVTTFATTTYAYPFSALNVPNAAGLPPHQKMLHPEAAGGSSHQSSHASEPKPLLSAQYEALSDED